MTTGRLGQRCGALGLLLSVAAALGAEEGPWQRLLKGEDAKSAKELERKIEEFESAGKFTEAVKPAEELLALRQDRQGATHWQTADARRRLETLTRIASLPAAAQQDIVTAGKLLKQALGTGKNRYADAEWRLRNAVKTYRTLLGEEHYLTALGLNQLAGNMHSRGRYADALALNRQALDIRRKVLGALHPATAESLNHLFLNLFEQSKFRAAEPFGRQALDIRRQVFGEQDPRTAESLSNLAVVLMHQGKSAEAEPLNRQALDIRRKVHGELHPATAESLNNLASNLQQQQKYPEAEGLLRQSLTIYLRLHGEQHINTAIVRNNLAMNLDDQGRLAEGEALHRKALASRRGVGGERHPDTASSLHNLAANLEKQGRYAEAEPLYRQALEIRHDVLGATHLHTAQSLKNLAHCLNDQERFAEAEPLLVRALAICRQIQKETQAVTTFLVLQELAVSLGRQGRHAEAETLLRQSLDLCRATYGEQHFETFPHLYDLAVNLNRQGRYAEAEPLYRQALEIQRGEKRDQHPFTAPLLHGLAANLRQQKKHAEAELLYRQALAISRNTLGEQHRDTAFYLTSLAIGLTEQHKDAEAETYYRVAVASFEVARLRVGTSGFERAPFAARYSPFANLAACLALSGQSVEAWQAAEAGLARGLLDDLTPAAHLFPSAEEERRQRARSARLDRLDHLVLPLFTAPNLSEADKARLGELVKERERLQKELAREAAERSRREVVSLEGVQKQLPADTALVFWIDLGSGHWGCVVRHSGPPTWVALPGSGDKGAWTQDDVHLPNRLRESLDAGEADWRSRADRLFRQRLAPLEAALGRQGDLPAVRRLLAVPAGRMAGVPLEALTDRFTVSYVPSGTVLARLGEQHRPLTEPSLLALGDPVFAIPEVSKPAPLPEYGLLLTRVLPDGNAAKAGLRGGDVLLRYGEQKLLTHADLKPAAGGDPVPAQVWRKGQTLDVRLAPGKLGAAYHREPAPQALRRQRELDALLTGRTRDEVKPLPGSRHEVKVLQPLFPRAEVLLGSDASEQMLDELAATGRLPTFRVLHFATHGHINPAVASRSALLLARDRLPDPAEQTRLGRKVYDGRLTVAAIAASWKLDADLVTLSACETALGPQGGGEGLLGFSQVLLHKGARSLLLSLWKVDDTATALLMTRFYENWLGKREDLKKPLPKTEALREAKTWLRQLGREERDRLAAHLVKGELRGTDVAARPVVRPKEGAGNMPYAHPRYWAAFILLGDPD